MKSKKNIPKMKMDKDLARAIKNFPKVLKAQEKSAKEKKRIMRNFLSVKSKVYGK